MGRVDAAYMASLLPMSRRDDRTDLIETPTQSARLAIEMQLPKPIEANIAEVRQEEAELSVRLTAESARFENFELPAFTMEFVPIALLVELRIAPWLIFIALNYAAFYVGRSVPARTLTIFALSSILLLLLTIFAGGKVAMWAIIGWDCSIPSCGRMYSPWRSRGSASTRHRDPRCL